MRGSVTAARAGWAAPVGSGVLKEHDQLKQRSVQRCRVTRSSERDEAAGSRSTHRCMPSLVLQESAVGAPENGPHSVAAALLDHKPVLVRSLPPPSTTRCGS